MNLSTVFPGASPKALRKTAVLALILALASLHVLHWLVRWQQRWRSFPATSRCLKALP